MDIRDLTKDMSDDVKRLNPELAAVMGGSSQGQRPSKYGNVRTEMDGESFDSGKEATDAAKFKLAVRSGEYVAYFHHVRFPLQGGIWYEADHVLINNDLTVTVLDSKGVLTKEFKLKRKLFREKYHHDIQVI